METEKSDNVDFGCVSSGLPDTVSIGTPDTVSSGIVPEITDIIGVQPMLLDGVLSFFPRKARPDIVVGKCKWVSTNEGELIPVEERTQYCGMEFEIAANPTMKRTVAAQKKSDDSTFDVDKTLTDQAVEAWKEALQGKTDEFVAAGCTRIWRIFRNGTDPAVLPTDGLLLDGDACFGKCAFLEVAIIGG